MIQRPVAVLANANQIRFPIFVYLRQCQIWALPERMNVVHYASPYDCRALVPEEIELVRVGVAVALMVLIPLDLPP